MKGLIMNESPCYSFCHRIQTFHLLNTEKFAIHLQTCHGRGLRTLIILTELLFLANLLLVLMTHGVEDYSGAGLQALSKLQNMVYTCPQNYEMVAKKGEKWECNCWCRIQFPLSSSQHRNYCK